MAAGVDEAESAAQKKSFAAMLSYPADRAAEDIIEATINRRPRLLIGQDAKALDVMARTRPAAIGS